MNKFLNSYETLNYEPIKHRLKRSADGSIVATNIRFNTHNRFNNNLNKILLKRFLEFFL